MIDCTQYLRKENKNRARMYKENDKYYVAYKQFDNDTGDELEEQIFEVNISELQTVYTLLNNTRRDINTVITKLLAL